MEDGKADSTTLRCWNCRKDMPRHARYCPNCGVTAGGGWND